jgi:hypothetical protein
MVHKFYRVAGTDVYQAREPFILRVNDTIEFCTADGATIGEVTGDVFTVGVSVPVRVAGDVTVPAWLTLDLLSP